MVYKEWKVILEAIWTYKVSLEVTQVLKTLKDGFYKVLAQEC